MTPLNPLEQWNLRGELLRLVYVSSRIKNAAAPLSYIAVGEPGSGKTEMIQRGGALSWVVTFSNFSYMGLINSLPVIKAEYKSAILIPDLGTLVGRRADVGAQAVATLAMLAAEGIGRVAVGRTEKDFGGVRASVIGAVTEMDLSMRWEVFNQNAFLSRAFLPTFDFPMDEIFAMSRLKTAGRTRHLRTFRYPHGTARRMIRFPETHQHYVEDRWAAMKINNADRVFAFRTMESFKTLLCCSAYERGASAVTKEDLKRIDRIWPVIEGQYRRSAERK